MISIWRRGIKPEQKKEPALNRDIQVFTENVAISRLIPETRNIKDISPAQIIETARIAEIADELDGKPLWEKLGHWMGKCTGVVADAIDDEPYLSSRLALMVQRREDVASGLQLCGKALGVGPEGQSAAVYHSIIAFGSKIPDGEDMKIRRLGGKYPIDLSEREKGEKNGILYIGVGAMVHLHRAVFEMRRQTTAFVTLAGDCVSAPFNAELPLGMPLKRALEFCGLSEDPTYICTSGSLTANAVLDPETAFVAPDTRAILAFHRYDHAAPAPCIGCGRCMEVCPQQLPVFYLYRASLYKQLSLLKRMGQERCFECGACTYVCPSHLDMVPVLRQGKELILASSQEEAAVLSPQTEETGPETQEEAPAGAQEDVQPGKAGDSVPEAVEEVQNGESPTVSAEEDAEILAIKETQFGREIGKPTPEKEELPPPLKAEEAFSGKSKSKKRSKKKKSKTIESPDTPLPISESQEDVPAGQQETALPEEAGETLPAPEVSERDGDKAAEETGSTDAEIGEGAESQVTAQEAEANDEPPLAPDEDLSQDAELSAEAGPGPENTVEKAMETEEAEMGTHSPEVHPSSSVVRARKISGGRPAAQGRSSPKRATPRPVSKKAPKAAKRPPASKTIKESKPSQEVKEP